MHYCSDFIVENYLAVIVILFIFSAMAVLWQVYNLQNRLVRDSALDNALLYSQAIAEFRSLYTSEVVIAAKKQGIEVTHDYESKEGAIPLPATLSMKLGKNIGDSHSGAETRLYSAYPFPWRGTVGEFKDEFSRKAWDALQLDSSEPYFQFENYNGIPSLRYATADVMHEACVSCHNNHLQTPKNDWQVGDLRGVLEIIHPMDKIVASTEAGLKNTFILLLALIIAGALCLVLVAKSFKKNLQVTRDSEMSLKILNDALQSEVKLRAVAEVDLKKASNILEQRVQERTRELSIINNDLQAEILTRVKKEKILNELTVKLDNNNQYLQEFAYGASHDLQEPVNKILMFSSRILKKYSGNIDEKGLDQLQRIEKSAARMKSLIQGLLSYSRINTEKKIKQPVKLSKIVSEVCSDLEVRIEELNADVQVGDLPIIEADPLYMRQLFQNLISNSLKYHKDDVEPFIQILSEKMFDDRETDSNDEFILQAHKITIKDNGIGFEDKYKERIFGVFQRLHGRSTYQGSGIGLSLCKKIVELHGGHIAASGTTNEGAMFTIVLPIDNSRRSS